MIGGNLKYFRQKRNLGQEEVAKIMHINSKTLSRWKMILHYRIFIV